MKRNNTQSKNLTGKDFTLFFLSMMLCLTITFILELYVELEVVKKDLEAVRSKVIYLDEQVFDLKYSK